MSAPTDPADRATVETRTALIVGASGLVGTAAVERFLGEGYDVVAMSRRRPEIDGSQTFRHLPVDLHDPVACRDAAKQLSSVTDVVYAAVEEKQGLIAGWTEPEQMQRNLTMLRNLLDPLCREANIRHVNLLQGTKAYGAHLHRIPIPARERQERDDHENFYWLHEDHVRALAEQHGFEMTIWRPQLIVGPNHGVVMNLPPVIGAYAAICRAEGQPFSFPGGGLRVWEAVDTRLLAEAMAWATTAPEAAGETFNITNGEVFEWRTLWPSFADALGVEVGPDEPRRLATYLPDNAALWSRITAEHGLRSIPMDALLGESHHYADMCFGYGREESWPTFLSTVKLRQAGFHRVYDTEASFRHWFEALIERRILPVP